MSSNLDSKPRELKALVTTAAAKERRNLGLSIAFTIIVLAVGIGWIVYSARKVVQLKAQEAGLTASITKLNAAIAEREGVLREANLAIVNIRPFIEASKTQDAKTAASALSNAQESLQVLINDPVRGETRQQTEPSPTPARVTVPGVTG